MRCECGPELFPGARFGDYPHLAICPLSETYRRAAIAKWRRRAHRIAVFKAIVAPGLIFLICGSAALIAYALEW